MMGDRWCCQHGVEPPNRCQWCGADPLSFMSINLSEFERAARVLKPRRWFLTPELIQWSYMVACGQYAGPFFSFPHDGGVESWFRVWKTGVRVGLAPDMLRRGYR